jgi:hypothetical protein
VRSAGHLGVRGVGFKEERKDGNLVETGRKGRGGRISKRLDNVFPVVVRNRVKTPWTRLSNVKKVISVQVASMLSAGAEWGLARVRLPSGALASKAVREAPP